MFRVFADHTRLRVLRLLQDGSLCVGDLVEILGAPQPTVSRHLAYLRRNGFVDARQYGLWMFYALAPAQGELHAKLLECLAAAARLLPGIKADVALADRVRRSGGCCPEGHRLMEESRQGPVDKQTCGLAGRRGRRAARSPGTGSRGEES